MGQSREIIKRLNICSYMTFHPLYLQVAYRGVFVSLNPRKTPCMANDRRTAGAPSDLRVKYSCAGVNIGESYIKTKPFTESCIKNQELNEETRKRRRGSCFSNKGTTHRMDSHEVQNRFCSGNEKYSLEETKDASNN